MTLNSDVTLAAGRIGTGFSKPYVALYSAAAGNISYNNAQLLARGVSVDLSPEASDNNNFYADNVASESTGGIFTGGTVTLTVDGLHPEARKLITGGEEKGTDGWTGEGDKAKAPYVSIGYIARYMSNGVEIYVPTILVKTKVQPIKDSKSTQEESIDWQTQELTFDLFRGDDSDHHWKFIGEDFATETEAEKALKAKFKSASV